MLTSVFGSIQERARGSSSLSLVNLTWRINELIKRVDFLFQVMIWEGNSSREFLDSVGLSHREVGDLGPVYGFQWRHFGADYTDMHADYSGQGVDQLAEVIHKIKNKPDDRRIIMCAWNPKVLIVPSQTKWDTKSTFLFPKPTDHLANILYVYIAQMSS